MQAISIVDNQLVWVSGHDGQVLRSSDQGNTWTVFEHPMEKKLQFRDIHGMNEENAIIMSSGSGSLSRIYRFQSPDQWQETFRMEDSIGFLDCMDFWDSQRGIAYGDAIDEYPYILTTKNGGISWERVISPTLPIAGAGEGGFAASGTCVETGENGKAWIATGANGNCRFLLTTDYGKSWEAVESPIVKGAAAGNTTISMTGKMGFAAGGDLSLSDQYTDNCAYTQDGGLTWKLTNKPITKGAFYGSALSDEKDQYFAFVCGPNGIDYTTDFEDKWKNLDTLNYWAVAFKGNIGFAAGTNGKILKISL
ncbi:MAG: hypothetical protein AAF789_07345 [Bacteroidota bacterium]